MKTEESSSTLVNSGDNAYIEVSKEIDSNRIEAGNKLSANQALRLGADQRKDSLMCL